MYCSNCGKESNKKVCEFCGVKKGKTKKFCMWCGNELQEKASKCTNCHEKVKKNVFGSILLFIIDFSFIALFSFFAYMSKSESYESLLLYVATILGIVIALPIWKTIIKKKTHDNHTKRKIIKVGRYGVIVALTLLTVTIIIPGGKYNNAVKLIKENPIKALSLFDEMGGYRDSENQVQELSHSILDSAEKSLGEGDWEKAEKLLNSISKHINIEDAKKEMLYQKGVYYLNNYKYNVAKKCFKNISGYKDVDKLKKNIGIGLCGNSYSNISSFYEYYTFGTGYVDSWDFYEWEKDSLPPTVNKSSNYFSSDDSAPYDELLDTSYELQYRVVDGKFYATFAENDAPENLDEWTLSYKITDIVWEGDEIDSFKLDSIEYS